MTSSHSTYGQDLPGTQGIPGRSHTGSDESLGSFTQQRSLLFSVAYRMLGSASDAEDIVQDAFLRWQAAPRDEVRSPRSYLVATVTRLCIDQLKSARARREVYVGPWLPEPVVTGGLAGAGDRTDMTDTVELAESVTMAFLLLLEQLGPVERAVFLLHDVFSYDYAEIAPMVGKSEANCRQMVTRARRRLREQRPRFVAPNDQHRRLADKFLQVSLNGDIQGLLAMLSDGAVVVTDGGGKSHAALHPIHGADKVARFVFGVLAKTMRLFPTSTFTNQIAEVNGQVGVISNRDGVPYSVFTLEFDGERISRLNAVVNPDKLERIPR